MVSCVGCALPTASREHSCQCEMTYVMASSNFTGGYISPTMELLSSESGADRLYSEHVQDVGGSF